MWARSHWVKNKEVIYNVLQLKALSCQEKEKNPLLHPSAGNDPERFREGLLTVQQVLIKHCSAC